MKPLKRMMHTPLNLAAFFVSVAIFPIGGLVIWNAAANDGMRIFGLAFFGAAFLGVLALFLLGYRIFDRVYFYEDRIERRGIFRKECYGYDSFRAVEGEYLSAVERKPCLIFTPHRSSFIVACIDTSKGGNLIPANRMGCLFCRNDRGLSAFLRQRKALEWYGERE